jgi:hypothetical protein
MGQWRNLQGQGAQAMKFITNVARVLLCGDHLVARSVASMILVTAVCSLTIIAAVAQVADPLGGPVDAGQASEALTNRYLENSTPLVKESDNATIRTKTSAPENSDDLPDDFAFSDADKPGNEFMKTEGTTVPSQGHFMGDGGFIRRDGTYAWSGGNDQFVGKTDMGVGDILYSQAPENVETQAADSSNGPMIQRARQGMNGLPITNSQFSMLAGSVPQMTMDRLLDPKGWKHSVRQMQQTQQAQGSDSQALSAEGNGDAALQGMMQSLINVANESAASFTQANAPHKSYSQAIWMIQQMYKRCYMPMALLLLLPGAILTQVKGYVSHGILGTHDEDSSSPFVGILRAIIAIFLIPATQLIVSYGIDIGNSLTLAVKQSIDLNSVMAWSHEQTFNSAPANNQNFIDTAPTDIGAPDPSRGKLADGSEKTAVFEKQSYMTTTLQGITNTIANLMTQGLATLNCFQVVLICYLFLLGPIAAALYAWPSYSGPGGTNLLFKKTFSSWLDGVVVLVLWKFWWCIVLLCMSVRLQQNAVNPTDEFETFVYLAFMGILIFVPFQPFDFKPGEIVSVVLEKASKSGGGKHARGGAAGGGGGGGASSSASGESNSGDADSESSGSSNQSGGGTADLTDSDSGASSAQRSVAPSMSTLDSGGVAPQFRPAAPNANPSGPGQQSGAIPSPVSSPTTAPPPARRDGGSLKSQSASPPPPLSSTGDSSKNEF